MIRKAKKKICKNLVLLTKEFHNKLFAGEYDEVYEELITEESAIFLAALAWPFVSYKKNNLDFLVKPEFNPNPDIPIHDSLSLAFQMDIENCRSGLFEGIAEGLKKHQLHQFNQKSAVAFIDGRSAILAADTPAIPLFMIFVNQKKKGYLIDFLALWLFSMEMRASILMEIATYAQSIGNIEYAIEYLTLTTQLRKPYLRIEQLLCKHPILGQYVTPERKQEISQQLEIVEKASERLQLLTTTQKPTLPLEEYEHILEIVMNMATVMERSPEAFSGLGEEHIRQHFLVQLNGHFKGEATGETFNFNGKTDIIIRRENVNIFIAECKFWKGYQAFSETIDQVLNYATWRDARLAIFVFNQNRNLSNVLENIRRSISTHPLFIREESYDLETGFRFYLSHKDDPQRELLMTVLVFDVPK